MKLYQVYFDATRITLLTTPDKLLSTLQNKDKGFRLNEKNELVYKWSDDSIDPCGIEEVDTNKSQILHWEQH